MTNLLRHRGPDAEGHMSDGPCVLGHRRLKVIDLSDNAAQPMWDLAQRVAVSFNGEIYNFLDLRERLRSRYHFKSDSDTEVIVNGYREWGTDLFQRLNGMFALAVWDRDTRRLVLARDRLGKKPLFYYWDGAVCVFGSSVSSVVQHPATRRVIDEQSLAQYFTFGFVPTPRSIFRNIHKVKQGAYVEFSAGTRREMVFWEPPAEEESWREHAAVDELDALLQDAVGRRMRSDVPLGFFLSGGVDSTLVAAVGRQLADDVHAFTIGFGDRGYDEAPAARRVAEFLKLRHTERRLDERQIAWSLDEIGALIDEPFADSSLIPTYFVSLSARQDVTVALSGDGGDELFCGYAKYRHLRHGLRLMCAPQLVRAFAAAAAAACPWDGVAKAATALRSESTADLMRWLVSVWKPDELRELMPDVIVDWEETEFCRALGRFAHREPLAALMAADVRAYLCDDILQKVDRASMAVSLELRSPLLDYRIVEFACRLPLSLKLRNGEQKYVLKKLLERYVPRPLWDRPKQGFKAPMKELYRERSDDEMHAAIDRLCHTFGDVLRPVAMRRVLEDHRKGRRDYSQKLYSLEVLSRWCEMQS